MVFKITLQSGLILFSIVCITLFIKCNDTKGCISKFIIIPFAFFKSSFKVSNISFDKLSTLKSATIPLTLPFIDKISSISKSFYFFLSFYFSLFKY